MSLHCQLCTLDWRTGGLHMQCCFVSCAPLLLRTLLTSPRLTTAANMSEHCLPLSAWAATPGLANLAARCGGRGLGSGGGAAWSCARVCASVCAVDSLQLGVWAGRLLTMSWSCSVPPAGKAGSHIQQQPTLSSPAVAQAPHFAAVAACSADAWH